MLNNIILFIYICIATENRMGATTTKSSSATIQTTTSTSFTTFSKYTRILNAHVISNRKHSSSWQLPVLKIYMLT